MVLRRRVVLGAALVLALSAALVLVLTVERLPAKAVRHALRQVAPRLERMTPWPASWCRADAFFIDEAEVTNAEYAAFLADAFPAAHRTIPRGLEDAPVRGVSYAEAEAFARWAGSGRSKRAAQTGVRPPAER